MEGRSRVPQRARDLRHLKYEYPAVRQAFDRHRSTGALVPGNASPFASEFGSNPWKSTECVRCSAPTCGPISPWPRSGATCPTIRRPSWPGAAAHLRARLSGLLPGLVLPRRPSADQGTIKHERWLAQVLLAIIQELTAGIAARPASGPGVQPGAADLGAGRLSTRLPARGGGCPRRSAPRPHCDLLESALAETDFDLPARLDGLRALARDARPSATCAALLAAARARGIPARRLARDVLQLGYGARQRRLLGGGAGRTAAAPAHWPARTADLLHTLLACVGVACTANPPPAPTTGYWSSDGACWPHSAGNRAGPTTAPGPR